jgi:hypothetical protein
MLKNRKVAVLALFVLTLAVNAFAADIGNYRIRERVDFAGTTVEPGMYAVSIVDGEEGKYIQLSKDGQAVAKDLAIVIPARGTAAKPQVQITRIAGQEFLRIRIREGDSWYYAYMKRLSS